MIDWQKVRLDDFNLEVDSGEIRDSGISTVFPIRVMHKDGRVAFIKSVSIRSQFYSDLRSLPDWKSALWKIFYARIREELAVYRKRSSVSIEDKVSLMFDSRRTLADGLENDPANP